MGLCVHRLLFLPMFAPVLSWYVYFLFYFFTVCQVLSLPITSKKKKKWRPRGGDLPPKMECLLLPGTRGTAIWGTKRSVRCWRLRGWDAAQQSSAQSEWEGSCWPLGGSGPQAGPPAPQAGHRLAQLSAGRVRGLGSGPPFPSPSHPASGLPHPPVG